MKKEDALEKLIKVLTEDEHWKNLELMLQDGGCVCPCCLGGCH